MALTDFEYGTIITADFLDALFFKDHGSGKRGIQFDGLNENGHLPQIISEFITDGAVTNTKIANASISTSKIQDNAINTAKITDESITEAKLGAGSVSTSVLADGSVSAPKLGTDSVTGAKIASSAINAPLFKAPPQGGDKLYLGFDTNHLGLRNDGALRLSALSMSGIVTNPQTDPDNNNFTTFKEFQFGTLSVIQTFGLSGKIFECRVNTGIDFDSNTPILASAMAKIIRASNYTGSVLGGHIVFSSSQALDPSEFTGTLTDEKEGSLTLIKNTSGKIEAVLKIATSYDTVTYTMASYSFKLLMGYRAN